MKLRRTTRILVGSFVLLSVAVILSPHVMNRVAQSAVINAPVVSVKSPFDGFLTSASRRPGDPVLPGDKIVELIASRAAHSETGRLEAHRAALASERAAITAEIESLKALDADLSRRSEQVRSLAGDVLVFEREALLSDTRAAEEDATFLRAEADRLASLRTTGTASKSHHERAASEASKAESRLAALRSNLALIERKIFALKEGSLPAFGSEDGSYARQRRDEVALRLADLRTRRDTLGARMEAATGEIAALKIETDRLSGFAPQAESQSVIWTASPASGSAIASGDEILQVLDCSRRFIEVSVSESALGDIDIGSTAWVRLKESKSAFLAEVETVRGAGAQTEIGRLAAEPARMSEKTLTVMLRLEPADVSDPETAARFCNVGRTAEVRFERNFRGGLVGRLAWLQERSEVAFDAFWQAVSALRKEAPEKASL